MGIHKTFLGRDKLFYMEVLAPFIFSYIRTPFFFFAVTLPIRSLCMHCIVYARLMLAPSSAIWRPYFLSLSQVSILSINILCPLY